MSDEVQNSFTSQQTHLSAGQGKCICVAPFTSRIFRVLYMRHKCIKARYKINTRQYKKEVAVQLQSREEKQWINCPKFNFIKCSGTQKSLKPWFRRTESWREFVPDMWCIKPERFFFFFFFFNSREENSKQTRPGWSENVRMVRNRAADQKYHSVCYKPAVGF